MGASEVALPTLAHDLAPNRNLRLRALAADNFQFIWRCLRRFGLAPHAVDDAAQQVFEVAARRLDDIAVGRERAFLFKTALHAARNARRAVVRGRLSDAAALEQLTDPGETPEDAVDTLRSRALLDAVLDALPLELRSVFVLFELEELTTAEIARLLEIPPGTVASRLRRARQEFHTQAKRIRARREFDGRWP
jgi:RNA polymerase sigma-70 factor (ECF subfamily)